MGCVAGQVVPFPLFWYRQSATSLGQTTSAALYHERTRRPYEAALPPSMAPMLLVAQGLQRARHDASVEQVRKPVTFGYSWNDDDLVKLIECCSYGGDGQAAEESYGAKRDSSCQFWKPSTV